MIGIKCQVCEVKEAEYIHTDENGVKYLFCAKCYARYLAKQEEKQEVINRKKMRLLATKGFNYSDDGIRGFCWTRCRFRNGYRFRLSFIYNNEEKYHCWVDSYQMIRYYKNRWTKDKKAPHYRKRNEVEWKRTIARKKKMQDIENTETNGKRKTKSKSACCLAKKI